MSAFAATRQLLESKKLGDYVDEKRTELSCVTKTATVADALKVRPRTSVTRPHAHYNALGDTCHCFTLCSCNVLPYYVFRAQRHRVGADRLYRGLSNKLKCFSLALQLLEKLHVLSVPVVDEDGEYAGCISVGDMLRAFVQGTQAETHAVLCCSDHGSLVVSDCIVVCMQQWRT